MTKPKAPPRPAPDDADQSKRFVDMAREIEASESEEEAKRVFRKIAKPANPKAK